MYQQLWSAENWLSFWYRKKRRAGILYMTLTCVVDGNDQGSYQDPSQEIGESETENWCWEKSLLSQPKVDDSHIGENCEDSAKNHNCNQRSQNSFFYFILLTLDVDEAFRKIVAAFTLTFRLILHQASLDSVVDFRAFCWPWVMYGGRIGPHLVVTENLSWFFLLTTQYKVQGGKSNNLSNGSPTLVPLTVHCTGSSVLRQDWGHFSTPASFTLPDLFSISVIPSFRNCCKFRWNWALIAPSHPFCTPRVLHHWACSGVTLAHHRQFCLETGGSAVLPGSLLWVTN